MIYFLFKDQLKFKPEIVDYKSLSLMKMLLVDLTTILRFVKFMDGGSVHCTI